MWLLLLLLLSITPKSSRFLRLTFFQSFSDPAISSDSDSDSA
jgi:hypothetical protein